MKVGLLNIVTNNYGQFIDDLYESAIKYFCPEHERHFFLFTDNEANCEITKKYEPAIKTHLCKIPNILPYKHQGKHLESYLYALCGRYILLSMHQDLIKQEGMDCVFYSDIDLEFVDYTRDDIFPVGGKKLSVVEHPCQPNVFGNNPYEDNPECMAYLPQDLKTKPYLGSAFVGGNVEEFFKMANVISHWAALDMPRNVIPKWHDETYLYKYYTIYNEIFNLLSPSYLWPTYLEKEPDYKPILLALTKDRKKVRNRNINQFLI